VIQLTKRDDSVYPGTDHPFRKRITSFLTQGLEKETVNHLCCYNETNDNKFQIAVMKCRYEVISTKIKKSLLKAEIITWASLEHSKQPAVLPDPNFLNIGFNETGLSFFQERDAALNKFFREIYLNSDEDMRILHNQLVESNGTVLSIDWKDVGAKKIESTLHDDLALMT
ncbi:hypothetical protein IGI04_030051, partial [Brassica rapa subsp. trilocularis]